MEHRGTEAQRPLQLLGASGRLGHVTVDQPRQPFSALSIHALLICRSNACAHLSHRSASGSASSLSIEMSA